MSGCRKITYIEKGIIYNLTSTTNLTEEEAKEIAFQCYRYGYIIHKNNYELLEIDRNHLREKVNKLLNALNEAKNENKKLKIELDSLKEQEIFIDKNNSLEKIMKDFRNRPPFIIKESENE